MLDYLLSLGGRELCLVVGLGAIALSGITYWLQGPTRIANSLDNIASAIKGKD